MNIMAQRGRKSAASLAVSAHLGVAVSETRLPAPLHLSDAERAVWLEVVNDQPASTFTPTHGPMLEQYCRHVVQARLIANELQNFDPAWLNMEDGLKRYKNLLALHELEGRAFSSLATRMRLTRQSIDNTVVARALVNAPKAKKPWEMTVDADGDGEE